MTSRTRRYDVNLSILFTNLPLLDRPAAAAAAGFDAVELWWPFASPAPAQSDVDRLVDSIASAGMTLACLNFDGGDFGAGERGLVSDPALRSRLRDNVPVAVDLARRLGCGVLNALYGNVSGGETAAQRETAVENLAFAARAASAIGAVVVVEALNPAEYPDYGLRSLDAAATVARRVQAGTGERIGLLLDVYHAARMITATDADVAPTIPAAIQAHRDLIAHVQIADAPGRGRPGTGTIDFGAVFAALDDVGYAGYVGLEYLPSPDPADTFAWLGRLS